MQAGFLLVILSGLAELCDQLGAVDFAALPGIGKDAPAIIAGIGVTKVVLRALVVLLGAYNNKQEPTL